MTTDDLNARLDGYVGQLKSILDTELVIRDVTPRPKSPDGMTDADRWRQAGRKPDGTPSDPSELR